MSDRLPRKLFIWLCAATALLSAVSTCSKPDSDSSRSNGESSRIVSLSPHLTEIVFAAGAGDRLVGVDAFSDYPEEVRVLPRIGDAFRVDLERLIRLSPDLVLAWASSAPTELVDRMRQMGLRVEVMEIERIEDVAEQIRLIGRLAGTEQTADQAADAFLAGVDSLAPEGVGETKRVFYQISANPWFTVTRRHVIGQILERCGAENIFADLPELAPGVSLEAIVAAQPEIIIAARSPAETGDWRTVWNEWLSIPAVRGNQLFAVNADLVSRPGPRLVQGARELCRILTQDGKNVS